jgi:hypothetical protein
MLFNTKAFAATSDYTLEIHTPNEIKINLSLVFQEQDLNGVFQFGVCVCM